MTQLVLSPNRKGNQAFVETERRDGQSNLEWLEPVLASAPSSAFIVLLGGTDMASFRLRVAQSVTRQDMSASAFSHVLVLGRRAKKLKSTRAWTVSLHPSARFGFAPRTNGLSRTTLEEFADPDSYPNVAAIELDVDARQIEKATERFAQLRAHVDCAELLWRWLGFAWGVGEAPNPLVEGMGEPSAVAAELLVAEAGGALTPQVASRSSSPEAIWQSARWWSGEVEQPADEGGTLRGAWWVPHWYVQR